MQSASPTELLQRVTAEEPLDLEAVLELMRERMADAPATLSAQRFGGGSSNLTYLLTDGVREWVLRRPPSGPLLPTAHDMQREHRVLAALSGRGVPVARPILLCTETGVLGAPFYIMERRRGIVVRESVPPEVGESAARRRAASFAVVDAMVALHAVDWQTTDLADGFGKPDGYLERQLRRWREQWMRSKDREVAEIEYLHAFLEANRPQSLPAVIVHGDFRLENCMLDPEDLRVVAIFDWEMSTLGDPLADLGWMLAYWPSADDPPAMREALPCVSLLPGFPSRKDLVSHYEERSGRSTGAMRFYHALAYYKLAIIAQGIARRVRAGQIRLERKDTFGDSVTRIAAAGVAVAEAR